MNSVEALHFLPGAAGNRALWRPIADALSHPGPRKFWGWPGFHDLPADPSVTGISDLVDRVASALTGPSILFAQSMGGVIALRATLARPELVCGLILAVTSGGIDVSALGGSDWRPSFQAENPDLPVWFLEERADLSAELARIRVPVLLLFGDADPISPVRVGERLAELLPNSELVVLAGGTHDLIAERAHEVLPWIERSVLRMRG